jgi:hypothetical protein
MQLTNQERHTAICCYIRYKLDVPIESAKRQEVQPKLLDDDRVRNTKTRPSDYICHLEESFIQKNKTITIMEAALHVTQRMSPPIRTQKRTKEMLDTLLSCDKKGETDSPLSKGQGK